MRIGAGSLPDDVSANTVRRDSPNMAATCCTVNSNASVACAFGCGANAGALVVFWGM